MKSRVDEVLSAYAVSLPDFKQHIKWDPDDTSEDTLMTAYLSAATRQAEMFTRRVIMQADWNTYLESFCNVTLDVAPVDYDSIVIEYYNEANVLTPLATTEYSVIDGGADGYIEIIFDGDKPTLYDRYEPIVVSYTAGYEEDGVPSDIQVAIMMQAASYFENRTNEVAGTSISQVMFGSIQLLYPYKMMG